MYIQQAIIKIYSPSDTIINAYDAFTYYSNLTDIEFEIRKEFEEDPAECECVIYGVDRDVYKDIVEDNLKNGLQNRYIEIYFSKTTETELLFSGLVRDVQYKVQEGISGMFISFNENESRFKKQVKSLSMSETTLSNALVQIKSIYGYDVKFAVNINTDEYPVGRISHTGSLHLLLKQIIPKELSYSVGDKVITINKKGITSGSNTIEYTLTNENELLSYPDKRIRTKEKVEETFYIITAIYIPHVKYGNIVKIYNDPNYDVEFKKYKILKYAQKFSNHQFVTSLECEMI